MLSAPVKASYDLLPGLWQMWHHPYYLRVLPCLWDIMWQAGCPNYCGSTCATTGNPLDPHPKVQKLGAPVTDVDPDPNAEEKGRTVRKTPIHVIIIIIKISQNHNNSKIHTISSPLSRPSIWTQKNLLCINLEKFTGNIPPQQPKTEVQGICRQ